MEDIEKLIEELQGIYPLNDYGFQMAMQDNLRGFQDLCGEAADALERLRSENERLRAELAESQRRERAAVEDMEYIASEIEKCDWILEKDGEKVGSLHLGRCAVCSHKYCDEEIDGGCKFEWRGPGAGKGDTK